MSEQTGIQWTDASWNCISGCERISPGCARCYAEKLTATRLAHQTKYRGLAVVTASGEPHWTGEIRLHADELTRPLRWRKPRMIFVNSMSDSFYKDVPDEFLDRMFAVMALCPQHVFQVLTKRADRMAAYLDIPELHNRLELAADTLRPGHGHPSFGGKHMLPELPLRNVWTGFSAENQECFDRRAVDAAPLMRAGWLVWVSAEPLLGPVRMQGRDGKLEQNWLGTPGIRWVVVGGESGPDSRPCNVQHVRSLVEQCQAANVAVFVKQLGSHAIDANTGWPEGTKMPAIGGRVSLRDSKGGLMEEWPEDLRVRQFPEVARA